jgi:phage FluMu protein Com
MPIRFRCPQCRQTLSIATRKAGAEINCPRCGALQTVPGKHEATSGARGGRTSDTPDLIEAAAGETAADPMGGAVPSHASEEDIPGLDDLAIPPSIPADQGLTAEEAAAASEPVEERTPSGPVAPSVTPLAPLMPDTAIPEPPPTPLPAVAPREPRPPSVEKRSERGLPVPSEMILFPRRVFYIQAALYVVLAVVAFTMGYFIGRGEGRDLRQAEKAVPQRQSVLIEGVLSYRPDPSRVAGDDGAVIVLLPEGQHPEKRFSVRGMRPADSAPAESHETVEAIARLGGACTRAETGGGFSVAVPDRGKYRALLISRHVNRPQDFPVDEVDLEQIGKYFDQPNRLIDQSKYVWMSYETTTGANRIEREFGLDGQK